MLYPLIQSLGDNIHQARATEVSFTTTFFMESPAATDHDSVFVVVKALSGNIERGSISAVLSIEECETFAALFTRAATNLRAARQSKGTP